MNKTEEPLPDFVYKAADELAYYEPEVQQKVLDYIREKMNEARAEQRAKLLKNASRFEEEIR